MSALQPTLGQAALKRRSVAKLIFYPSATPTVGYDAGNITKWGHNDKRDRSQSMSNDLGAAASVVIREDVHTLGYGYKLTLDEWTDFLMMVKANSLNSQGVATQTSATSATASLTGILPGRTYDLGKRDIKNVALTVPGPVTLVVGVDYLIDLPSGQVTFINSANTTGTPTVSATFDVAALARRTFTPGGASPTIFGTFLLFEYDPISTTVRAEHSFSGNIVITAQNGEDEKTFRDASIEITCWSVPIIKER